MKSVCRSPLSGFLVLALAGVAVGGCDSPTDSASQVGARTQYAVAGPTSPETLRVFVPTGKQLRSFAVIASDGIDIEDQAQVLGENGGYARLANMGSGKITLGAEAKTGSLISDAGVFLRDGSHVLGNVTLAGTLETQNQWTVDGMTTEGANVVGEDVARTVDVPVNSSPGVHLEPDQHPTTPLSPGRYNELVIKTRSSLTLTAGDYFFDNFQIEPQAKLTIDSSEGRVSIHVRQTFDLKGQVDSSDGEFPDVFWSYAGTGTIFATTPLKGWVYAPLARINLEGQENTVHEGAFFAKSVRLAPGVKLLHRPMPWLTKSVTIDKAEVCSGEPYRVEVEAADPSGGEVTVLINGLPTTSLSSQSLGVPGPRAAVVSVVTEGGQVETTRVEFKVVDCEASEVYPTVGFAGSKTEQDSVQIVVTNADEFDDGTQTYHYDFGDGTTLVSDYPAVDHDYTNAMGRDEERGLFDVTVTVKRTGQPDVAATRTLTVWNTYAQLKKRGPIQPPTTQSDSKLKKTSSGWAGDVAITNREDTLLTLETKRVHLVPCDGDGSITYLPPAGLNFTVQPGESESLPIAISASQVPAGTCSADVHFAGSTAAGQVVHVPVHFGVDETGTLLPVADPLKDLLNYVANEGLVANPDDISFEELQLLHRQRRIPDALRAEQFYQAGGAAPGEVCNPDDLLDPPAPQAGFACTPTDEFGTDKEELTDYIANAHKGDLIFVRGCSMVNAIFSKLDPIQQFTHVGIMAEHRSVIRESTGESDRLMDHGVGVGGEPTDGFEEEALKYFWPGTMTSTVREAFVDGKAMVSPEGKTFVVRESFHHQPAQCPDDNAVLFPMVLTAPAELKEESDPRRLISVDKALEIDGHYRFGAYSFGKLMDEHDPAAPEWTGPDRPSGGDQATVCSGLVRQALVESGLHADSNLSLPIESDVRGEAANYEGLYFYDEDERFDAAESLYAWNQEMVARALSEATVPGTSWNLPGTGEALLALFTDILTDVPNQFVNCFASDSCSEDDKDHEGWEEPGAGYGVSPDNVKDHYDSAADGGLYGSLEPMSYRHNRFRRIYRWQPAAGTHALSGDVMNQGAPLADARVEVIGLGLDEYSDTAGAFDFEGITTDIISVNAQKVVDGTLREVTSCFEAVSAQWLEVECSNFSVKLGTPQDRVVLDLSGPSDLFRRVTMTGDLRMNDRDCWPVPDEAETQALFGVCEVNPAVPVAEMTFSTHVSGDESTLELCVDEVGYQMEATCVLGVNGAVSISGNATLYEGTSNSCGGGDEEDTGSFSDSVGKGFSTEIYVPPLSNTHLCGTDNAYFWGDVTLTNTTVP